MQVDRCKQQSDTTFAKSAEGGNDRSLLVAADNPVQLSRPHGAVITKRHRGPRPVRRGFGQLHGWLEVAEPAGRRLTDRRPTFQFAGDELGWYTLKRRRRHFAEINDPLADL